MRKKPRRHPGSSRMKQVLLVRIAIVLAILLFLAGMYLLTRVGPRSIRVSEDELGLERSSEAGGVLEESELGVDQLRQAIQRKVEEFHDVRTQPGAGLEAIEPLDTAISMQRRVIAAYPGGLVPGEEMDRVDELLILRDGYAGDLLIAESRDLQARAETAREAQEYDVASEHLREAIILQKRINDEFGYSPDKSISRLQQLEKALGELQVLPLRNEISRLETEAMGLANEEQFMEAAERMDQVVDLQRQINRDFRQTRFASQFALRNFERKAIDYRAGGFYAMSNRAEERARAALSEGREDEAAEAFREASEAQAMLNADFPQSSYADSDRVAALEAERETARSSDLIDAIRQAEQALLVDLRERQTTNVERDISSYFQMVQTLHTDFARSRHVDDDRMRRAVFLNSIKEAIPALQKAVYDRLAPVPGKSGLQLATTEVNQLLYRRVTGASPSSVKGDLLPVESVSWHDAEAFCERLAWLLGYTVRLPRESEARASLGDPDRTLLSETVWHSRNSDRAIQPVGTLPANANGFHDLLGNVAEWLENSEEQGGEAAARVFGGSARDDLIRLERVPVTTLEKIERNRFTGFRFIVDQSDPVTAY